MDDVIRDQLVTALTQSEAHETFADVVIDFPEDRINDFPPNVAYTPWHLLEHIRRTQNDILEFISSDNYKERRWPKDYWPGKDEKATKKKWQKTIEECNNDLQKLVAVVKDKKIDLSSEVPNGTGQTFVREILLVIDHTAYHVGEFGILRQVMGTWSKGHK